MMYDVPADRKVIWWLVPHFMLIFVNVHINICDSDAVIYSKYLNNLFYLQPDIDV